MSWQLQSLEALASTPAVDTVQAEQGSLELSHFLTQAPTDFLEPFDEQPVWAGFTNFFLERCCTLEFPGADAESRRNDLSQQLRQAGCESPEGWAILLALFPFSHPTKLKVEDAQPNCLVGSTAFTKRYEAFTNHHQSPFRKLNWATCLCRSHFLE